MRTIGTVAWVQIQRSPLKSGDPRRYSADPIMRVMGLCVTTSGLLGVTEAGEEIVDVHNTAHPQSRYRGDNSISFGFLHAYDDIRRYFGTAVADGAGGENLLIETEHPIDQVGSRIAFKNPTTGRVAHLNEVIPAPPCMEFSQFLAGRELSPAEKRDALQFLDGGRRGFYAAAADDAFGCTIHAGDLVMLLED